MTVLLIFNMSPEAIFIFRFDNPDMAKLDLLRQCHGCYINSNQEQYTHEVQDFLTKLSANEGGAQKVYDDTEVNTPYLDITGDCTIVVAGFSL